MKITNNVFKKWIKRAINPHMHKLVPRGPTHYIFGD